MNAIQAGASSTVTFHSVPVFRPLNFSMSPQQRALPPDTTALFPVTGSEGSPLRPKFEKLADEWRQNTAFSSSVTEMVLDARYQQIIGMGVAVVPLILQELQNGPDHWYWALAAITGANPAAHAPAGDIQAISDAWVDWGKRRGIIR